MKKMEIVPTNTRQFRKTARRIHPKNIKPQNPRGGIRM